MIVVVMVIYSIARTKLLNYSSLAYFPLTFLAAWVWDKWVDRKTEIGTWQVILIFLIAIVLFGPGHFNPLIGKSSRLAFQGGDFLSSMSLPGLPFRGMFIGVDPNGWWDCFCLWVLSFHWFRSFDEIPGEC